MLGTLLSLFSSGPMGILFGTIGGLAKKWQDNKHEREMAAIEATEKAADRAHDLALADKEIEATTKKAAMHLEETMYATDSASLSAASARQDAEISVLRTVLDKSGKVVNVAAGVLFTFATFTQKMIRPVLTVALCIMTWRMHQEVSALLGGLSSLTNTELMEIYTRIVVTMLNLTELAVSFWYVSRPQKKSK